MSGDAYRSFLKNSIEPSLGNLLLAQLKKIIFLRDHLLASSSSRMILVSEQNSPHATAMHFLDHSMHKPLCLCVREGTLIILVIEAIISVVRFCVVYALSGSLASTEIIPLVAPGNLSTFFSPFILSNDNKFKPLPLD